MNPLQQDFDRLRCAGTPWCLILTPDYRECLRALCKIPAPEPPSLWAWDCLQGHRCLSETLLTILLGSPDDTVQSPALLLKKALDFPLRGLYDEADYPSWKRINRCFDVCWNYFTMNTPQVLQAISSKLFVREQAKATVQWNEMLEEIRDGLRQTFKELVDALVDKLTPRPDGTRKKLVGVDRLLEFLDTFSKKDVADDDQLRTLVDDIRGLLQNQDISRLRKDQTLRELVQERMQSVKVVLDSMVVDAPTRQILLRE